jgi:signal transduction histidine kinase
MPSITGSCRTDADANIGSLLTGALRAMRSNVRMKVLIVDGNKEHRREMVQALGDLTNVVIVGAVANLRTALYALAEAPPDVVVTGATLPDGDSALLAERIHRLPRAPHVVVVTESRDQQARYLAAGVDRCVTRDEDLRGLTEVVGGLAARRRIGTIPPAEAHRLLGRMTANVVHDVNNYLGAAELALVCLRTDEKVNEKVIEQLRSSLDSAARLNRMLLSYARGIAPSPTSIDFGAIVHSMLGVAERLKPASVTFRAEIADDLPMVPGIIVELEQLVLNLLVNAIDAMPSGGTITVTVKTATQPRAIVLRVADAGAGMPAQTSGGGLGLGIVHSVVERHRGTVRFATQDLGGTVVTVVLPA